MADWQAWHGAYADPSSGLSQRLAAVQDAIRSSLRSQPAGPVRMLSMCAGQGHDVVGALADDPRRADVTGFLVELDPDNAALAADAIQQAGLTGLDVRVADAGRTDSYVDAVPADLLLVCGVFGNVPDRDVLATIDALPALSAERATVIWTRHRREPDLTPTIRRAFSMVGFQEQGFTSAGPG